MKFFNISIHDVTKNSLKQAQWITSFLNDLGVEKFTYLIIPKYHGEDSLPDSNGMLKEMIGNHEIAMHGYTHKGKQDWKFSHKRLLTEGEGEFVSFSDLRIRIVLGLDIMRKLELKPAGFIPPAWLINTDDISLFKDSSFDFLNTRHHIYNLKNGKKHRSPVMTFSSRGLLQTLSIWTYESHSAMLMPFRMLRIAIHPRDIDCPQKIKLLHKLIIGLKKTREESYFSEFIERR